MSLSIYEILTIAGCLTVTWLSRILPFVLLKKFALPKIVEEYLSFVPLVIMATLWFMSLFTQHLGHLPTVNENNLLASLPTVLVAVWTKNLLLVVLAGVVSLSLIQLIL